MCVISFFALVAASMFVATMSYGGLVGRTWQWSSSYSPQRLFGLVLPRLLDSNVAGFEEDGWTTGVVYESIRKTHGIECSQALLRPGITDAQACPCLGIPRRGIKASGSAGGSNRTVVTSGSSSRSVAQPFFYLKLHKVGSTTVTNALLMRCVEQMLDDDSLSLASFWPNTKAHYDSFMALSKLSGGGKSGSTFAEERAVYAQVLGRTPAAIERCRQLPLRISHNSIRSYISAGHCAASRGSIAGCAAQQILGIPIPAASLARTLVVLRKPLDRFISSM